MYAGLATAAPHIAPSQIPNFFKDATFGVPAGEVASSESPEPGVTIERDKAFGVPHIYGDTRAELMFGIGYASAEDRLFFIDALRHAGEGDLAQFAGGANAAMDAQVWASEPYTQQDLVNQVQYGLAHSADGPQILSDATNYVAGINAYIAKAQNPLFTGTMMPAEYLALGMSGPQPFTVEDLVKIATLVGGIFGNGGGEQLSNAVLYQDLEKKFGKERRLVAGSPEPKPKAGWVSAKSKDTSGFATFLSFDDPSDPEAPTTVHGKSFPYQTLPTPGKRTRARVALPDPGSVKYVNDVVGWVAPGRAVEWVRPAGQRRSRQHLVERVLERDAGDPGPSGPGRHDRRRPDRREAQHVQRAADQRQAQRQRASARRDGSAGVLLRARDPDGGGHPRAWDRCRRRRVPRRQPVRRARPRPRLRVVGDLGRPEHRRHVRGPALQPQRRSGQHLV